MGQCTRGSACAFAHGLLDCQVFPDVETISVTVTGFLLLYTMITYIRYIYIVVLKVHTLCGMLQHFAATTLGRRGMPFDNMWASDALRAQMGRFLALSQRF